MSWVWYSYSHFDKRGTLSYITKNNVFFWTKGCFIGPQINYFGRKRGAFSHTICEKGVFFKLGNEQGIRFGGDWGMGVGLGWVWFFLITQFKFALLFGHVWMLVCYKKHNIICYWCRTREVVTLVFRTLHGYEVIIITMTSNRSVFRVTGPLCREFVGYRWIPPTKDQQRGLWRFSDVGPYNVFRRRKMIWPWNWPF